MSDKVINNPAGRLFSILTKASKIGSGTYHEVWADVFGIKRNDFASLAKCFDLYIKECDALNNCFNTNAKPLQLDTEIIFTRKIYEVYDPLRFAQPWNSHSKQLITDATLSALSMASSFIPDDSCSVDQENIDALLKAVGELRYCVDEGEMSSTLCEYVRELIDQIEFAVLSYLINGHIAFKFILKKYVGDIVVDGEIIDQADPITKGKLLSVWEQILLVNGSVELIGKFKSLMLGFFQS